MAGHGVLVRPIGHGISAGVVHVPPFIKRPVPVFTTSTGRRAPGASIRRDRGGHLNVRTLGPALSQTCWNTTADRARDFELLVQIDLVLARDWNPGKRCVAVVDGVCAA